MYRCKQGVLYTTAHTQHLSAATATVWRARPTPTLKPSGLVNIVGKVSVGELIKCCVCSPPTVGAELCGCGGSSRLDYRLLSTPLVLYYIRTEVIVTAGEEH